MVREEKTMTRGEAVDFLEKCRWWFEPFTSEKEKWNEALDVAIEALTQDSRKFAQEFTQDLISRQDAIEYFMTNTNWHDEDGYPIEDWDDKRKLLEDYFNGIPSADRPTGWIPVSERLPSDSGNYLITVADLRLGHIEEYTVTMADFYARAKKWNSIVDVYAWMPLPEPYREDGEA